MAMYLPSIRPVVTCVTCLLAATAAIAVPPSFNSAKNSIEHVGRSYLQSGMRSIGYYGNWVSNCLGMKLGSDIDFFPGCVRSEVQHQHDSG
jgi:hypothetical protein